MLSLKTPFSWPGSTQRMCASRTASAVISLLKLVQDTLLSEGSRGLRFSGLSIAAEKAGFRSYLPDDLDTLQFMMVELRSSELHEMGEARGLAKDFCQCVTLINENYSQEDEAGEEHEQANDERLWRRWGITFAYLVVCRPFMLLGDALEEDRSDHVRRVFCNEGIHQNEGLHAAYANTSLKERPYAKKYFGIHHDFDEEAPQTKRQKRKTDFGDLEIVVESGLQQLSAQVPGAQAESVRWFGNRFAERFVSPNLPADVPWKVRILEAAAIYYEGADMRVCRVSQF